MLMINALPRHADSSTLRSRGRDALVGLTTLVLAGAGLVGSLARGGDAASNTSSMAAALVATSPAASPAGAPADATEVILSNGSVWRGSVGEKVEIQAIENGTLQTFVGELLSVERLYVKLATEVAGIKGTKVIVRTDMRSMTSVPGPTGATGGASGSGTAAPAGRTAGTSGAEAGKTTTPATPAASSANPAATPAGSAADPSAPAASGHPGVFYLPMEGTLGIGLRNEELIAIAEEADKYGPGQIIVLMIDSPGGLVIEGDEIHETFKKWKHKHRFVAWIRKAISGGAFTALHCDEIYFMSVGSLGAITMFDNTGSIKGDRLQAWLNKCSEVAEMGGRSPIPVRSMIDFNKIASYDRDERTGKVTWHASTDGQYVLSSDKENLTFNAQNALHSGFSDGTADTEAELAKLLGIGEWKEVNDTGRRLHREWQETIKRCMDEVPRLMIRMNDQGDGSERGLGIRISVIRDLIRWWDRAYHVMAYELPRAGLGIPPKERLERVLKDTQKQLSDLRERLRQNRQR